MLSLYHGRQDRLNEGETKFQYNLYNIRNTTYHQFYFNAQFQYESYVPIYEINKSVVLNTR